MEVLAYANIKDKEVHAKTVEVVAYASIRDKENNAKTASNKTEFVDDISGTKNISIYLLS